MTSAYSAAVPWTGERAFGHDRGLLLGQVTVMLAAGGRCVADMAALRDQPDVFGEVASAPTIWRTFDTINDTVLNVLRAARAQARATAWAAGMAPEQIVLDVDASLVEIHSERKQGATPHFKRGFGFHPMFCFLDATGEPLAGVLRPGNAAANSCVDQLAVVEMAIDQLPVEHRRGHSRATIPTPSSIRSWCGRLRRRGPRVHRWAGCPQLSVLDLRPCFQRLGRRHRRGRRRCMAAGSQPRWRTPSRRGDRRARSHRRWLARRHSGDRAPRRPHPGAQLRLWDHNGMRHQVVFTNQPGDAVELELRHRRHGQVENRIKNLKDCGLERMPFTSFVANAAWTEMVLCAADLLAWTQTLLFTGELAIAEPRTLRYRILHIAGRLIRSARRTWLRLPEHWPWTGDLLDAYRRLAAIT